MKQAKSIGNRLPEQWFRRGLWLIAFIFASFLIGLGGKIIGDLPTVSEPLDIEYYMSGKGADPLLKERDRLENEENRLSEALEQASLALGKQKNQTETEQTGLNNWLAARSATEQSEQNPEVIARTRKIDGLKAKEQELQRRLDALKQNQLDNTQKINQNNLKIEAIRSEAEKVKEADDRRIELKVFSYRLAITLPLLLIGAYLFAKKRHSKWWPFVWGFIYFALFAFFVELVPYLPSYGGYVRYAVGIVVTALVGRYAIGAMNRYLERKQNEETLPVDERQHQLDYDRAQQCLAKGICPGCERPLDFQQPDLDYCPHCSINLFNRCGCCETRKSAFNRYCFHCGAAASSSK
ncbi:MAG: serine endopeptidase [Neisseria sp.]|uniref:serine endopeptidase n=1 Tax=Neisseria sp. TaxID=192066 RepID=UPI0026DC74F3|nr:serine endopeptidase [Neisseria sp.]MDO4640220.1 serine endopeptidase [Neisseria sp.]